MRTGKVSAAIVCIVCHLDKKTRRVLPLNEVLEGKTVLSILKKKTPPSHKTANTNYLTEVSEDNTILYTQSNKR